MKKLLITEDQYKRIFLIEQTTLTSNEHDVAKKEYQQGKSKWYQPMDRSKKENWYFDKKMGKWIYKVPQANYPLDVTNFTEPGFLGFKEPLININNFIEDKKINIAKYITDYNKVRNHWSKLNIMFNWGNEGITEINDTWLKQHPNDWGNTKNILKIPTFNEYLEKNKTQLFSPVWLVDMVYKLSRSQGGIDKALRDVWEKRFKEEKGYNKDGVLHDKNKKPVGKGRYPNAWSWNKHLEKWVMSAWYDYPEVPPQFIYGGDKGINNKEIIKQIYTYRKNNPTNLENMVGGFIGLLNFVTEWNNRYWTQKINDFYLCDKIVYSSGRIGALFTGPSQFKHATWKSFCKKPTYGGNWIYNPATDPDDWGNKNYIKGCGCVNTPNIDISVTTGNPFSSFSVNPYHHIQKTLEDTREWKYKAYDIGKRCATDWHCWADIAAIAALMFACPFTGGATCAISGLMVATAIEVASGVGYVYEGLTGKDDAWKFNAGLQLFSVLTLGTGKVFKFIKGVGLGKYTKLYTNVMDNISLKYSDDIWKNMSKVNKDKIVADAFEESLQGLSSSEIKTINQLNQQVQDILVNGDYQQIIKSMKGMSKSQIADFNKMLKAADKNENLSKYIKNSLKEGKTMDEVLKTYTKYVPSMGQAAVQLSLMGLMYVYDKETANAILGGMKKFEELTGIPLRKKLGLSEDSDPQDSQSLTLQNQLKDFSNYSTLITEIFNYIEENIDGLLVKYNITPESNFKEVLINGEKSIIGEPLEQFLSRMGTITSIIKRMERENKEVSDIKEKLEYLYNEELKWLRKEAWKDNVIKQINKNVKSNPPSEEFKKEMEKIDWGNYSI